MAALIGGKRQSLDADILGHDEKSSGCVESYAAGALDIVGDQLDSIPGEHIRRGDFRSQDWAVLREHGGNAC